MKLPESNHANILHNLCALPRKVILLHAQQEHHAPEFVLYDLCRKECFNFPRAAYFVDNPDFDCLKGVAGYSHQDALPLSCDIWVKPVDFTQHMSKAPFNTKVRSFNRSSLRRMGTHDDAVINELAHEFNLQDYGFYSWDMKHDNHGFFIYEKNGLDKDIPSDYVLNGLSILSFCPIA